MCLTLADISNRGTAGTIPTNPSQAAFQADLPAPEIRPAPIPPMTNTEPVSGRAMSRKISTKWDGDQDDQKQGEKHAQKYVRRSFIFGLVDMVSVNN
jgi:hypothetical protein